MTTDASFNVPAPVPTDLSLSVGELALLAYFGGRLPIVLPSLPAQSDDVWAVVLDQLIARGLLIREGNEVSVLDTVEHLLRPIVEADFAFEATCGDVGRTWVASGQTIVEAAQGHDDAVSLNAVAFDQLEPTIEAFLGLGGPNRGADAEAIAVSAEELRTKLEAADNGRLPIELPAAPQFATALATGRLNRIEVRWVEGDEAHTARYEWVDSPEAGLWVSASNDDQVLLQQRSSVSLLESIVGLLP